MAEAATPRRAVHFGVFELNFVTGELRKAGIKIKLQDQPFLVLAMLLERPGELVTREELRSRLWPSGSFGVRSRTQCRGQEVASRFERLSREPEIH